jgi:hypothetical protein
VKELYLKLPIRQKPLKNNYILGKRLQLGIKMNQIMKILKKDLEEDEKKEEHSNTY